MAAIISVRYNIWKLSIPLVRWRTHFDPKHPKPPHFDRAKFLAAAAPVYKPDDRPPPMKCDFVRFKKETHRDPIPYENLVANFLRKKFEESEFIAIYHLNQLFQSEVLDTRRIFYKEGLEYCVQGTELFVLAVENTKFKPVVQLFNHLEYEAVVFCKHKSDVNKVIRLQKKTPHVILLGGILEDRLMSKNDLIAYSKSPSLPIARAQLCHTLSQAAQQTVGHLSYHQRNLSQMLTQYSQTESKDKK